MPDEITDFFSEGAHARQVGRATGTGDNHFETVFASTAGEVIEPLGGAVSGDDARFVTDPERIECLGGVLHRGPVGLAAHGKKLLQHYL